ncbi:N-formylglutamate amidohydrolase [Pseudidiomarina sediminum]|uniref:N-formylglutamate amidohydrolase n=1 Tax=Pseudidiomarina sediminum TaxID=431675 RepID=A0A432Z986_9GAMM|nr:N-formylglutamate amidohydrolase [Pseudidiomarina sediminum]
MRVLTEKAYTLWLPSVGQSQPLLFDSPHSSHTFPLHSQLNASQAQLKTGWDAFVEELWHPAVQHGASLLAANFSRMYIDPNRSPTDIDAELLAEPWPEEVVATPYSARGMGLIRRFALPNVPMYNGKLTVHDVQHRLDDYYWPYHRQLVRRLMHLHRQFGQVWHIDCHSMKSKGNAMNIDAGKPRPDVVVSDGNGTTAAAGFTEHVATTFRELGFSVGINDPYQGGHIVRRYGAPDKGFHSIQIELNRGLYMHEARFTKSDNFDTLQGQLTKVTEAILEYIQSNN